MAMVTCYGIISYNHERWVERATQVFTGLFLNFVHELENVTEIQGPMIKSKELVHNCILIFHTRTCKIWNLEIHGNCKTPKPLRLPARNRHPKLTCSKLYTSSERMPTQSRSFKIHTIFESIARALLIHTGNVTARRKLPIILKKGRNL